MQCTVEIFLRNQWQDCCTLEVPEPDKGGLGRAVLEYGMDYAFDETAPVSLRHPVSADRMRLPAWPSFAFDLIPQGRGRRHLLGRLEIGDGPAADWRLLCAGAFNPVGCLRVKEAVGWYLASLDRQDQSLAGKGFRLDEIEGREEAFIEHLQMHGMLASGTSGVQGVAPKFLLTQGKDGLWYADGALPDRLAARHWLVKLPRGKDPSDLRILRNEAAYMRVAQRMGLQVAALPELRNDLLFIPRFDRQVVGGQVLRFHQESVASLLGLVGYDCSPSQNEALLAVRRHCADPAAAMLEFVRRDVLNLAMGNTDNHARNTAVQVKGGCVTLTPLFDFAPMVLDREGIPRALRWRGRDRVELGNWGDVLRHLAADLPPAELAALRRGLHAFAGQVGTLERVMLEEGVDAGLVALRRHAVESQAAQLRELG